MTSLESFQQQAAEGHTLIPVVREVLSDLKTDPALAKIPVVIFTTSQANSDITRSYELGANCYLRKPGNLPDFVAVVQSMADFWLGFASLPQKEKR